MGGQCGHDKWDRKDTSHGSNSSLDISRAGIMDASYKDCSVDYITIDA